MSNEARELAQAYLMRRDGRFHHESYMPECRTELIDLLTRFAASREAQARLDEAKRIQGEVSDLYFDDWLKGRLATLQRQAGASDGEK